MKIRIDIEVDVRTDITNDWTTQREVAERYIGRIAIEAMHHDFDSEFERRTVMAYSVRPSRVSFGTLPSIMETLWAQERRR